MWDGRLETRGHLCDFFPSFTHRKESPCVGFLSFSPSPRWRWPQVDHDSESGAYLIQGSQAFPLVSLRPFEGAIARSNPAPTAVPTTCTARTFDTRT